MRVLVALLVLAGASPAVAGRCADAWGSVPEWAPGQDYAAFRVAHPRTACFKRWTVLIWMAGDAPDLVEPMAANLQALQAAGGSTADLDVLVMHDTVGPGGLERLHLYPQGAADAGGYADESRPPEEVLRRFLIWGMSEYPAEHYLVILAGHGLGWRPALAHAPEGAQAFSLSSKWGGFGYDVTDKTVLDTPALRRALGAAVDGPLGGRAIDVVLSDACLMQSLEVVTELADVARYVGGSEQVQPYVGLPYQQMLKRLRRPPTDPVEGCVTGDAPCRLARQIATLQQRAVDRNTAIDANVRAQYTYATVDTSQLQLRLLPTLATFVDAVADHVDARPEASIDLGVVLGETPGFLGGSRDLGAFLTRMEAATPLIRGGPAAAVHRAARAARLALDETIVDHALGTSYRRDVNGRYAGMRGLAVWLPLDPADRSRRLEFFLRSRLHRTLGTAPGQRRGRWQRMLDSAFSPPRPDCTLCPP